MSRCMGAAMILPWFFEFSGVVLICFMLSRYTFFYGSITHTTRRLAHAIVQARHLFIKGHGLANLSILTIVKW